MTDRAWLAALLLAGGVLAPVPASAGASGPAPGPAPPNFLWIVAEDHGPHHGSYADPYAFTPNLDRLAAEGARFTRAFATAPICSPARTAIITGMYPTSIGAHHMRTVAVPRPGSRPSPNGCARPGTSRPTGPRPTTTSRRGWRRTSGARCGMRRSASGTRAAGTRTGATGRPGSRSSLCSTSATRTRGSCGRSVSRG